MSKTYTITEEQWQTLKTFVDTVDPMDEIVVELEQDIACEVLSAIKRQPNTTPRVLTLDQAKTDGSKTS